MREWIWRIFGRWGSTVLGICRGMKEGKERIKGAQVSGLGDWVDRCFSVHLQSQEDDLVWGQKILHPIVVMLGLAVVQTSLWNCLTGYLFSGSEVAWWSQSRQKWLFWGCVAWDKSFKQSLHTFIGRNQMVYVLGSVGRRVQNFSTLLCYH